MKKMSQKELLREGFGSALKNAAVTGGKAFVKDLAPITTEIVSDVIRAFTPKQQKDKESLRSFLEKDPKINKFKTTHYDEKSDTWVSTVNDKTKFFKLSGNTWKEIKLTPEKQKDLMNTAKTVPKSEKSNTQKPDQTQKQKTAPGDKKG